MVKLFLEVQSVRMLSHGYMKLKSMFWKRECKTKKSKTTLTLHYIRWGLSFINIPINLEWALFWKLNISNVIKIWLRITLQLIISLDFKPLSLVQHLYNCIAQVRPLTTSLHRTRKKHLNFNVYFLMFSSLILISNICNSNY